MSDADLRAMERRAFETRDPVDAVAFLTARLRAEGIHQPHPLLDEIAVRREWAEALEDDPWGELLSAQVELLSDDLTAARRSRLTHAADSLLSENAPRWFDSLTASHAEQRRPDVPHTVRWPGAQWFSCRRGEQVLDVRSGRLALAPMSVTAQAVVEGALREGPYVSVPPLYLHGLCRLEEVFNPEQVERLRQGHPSTNVDWEDWQERRCRELLELYGPDDWVGPLAECADLRQVHAARVELSYLGDSGRRDLFASPHWSGLRSLSLNYRGGSGTVTPATLGVLVTNSACEGLRALCFPREDDQDGAMSLGDEGAQILAGGTSLTRLERLDVPWCEIGPLGALLLVWSPHLGALRHLNLSENELGPESLTELAAQRPLARLASLDLGSVQGYDEDGDGREIDEAVVALVNSPNLSVARLDLSANDLGPDVGLAIAASPRMKRVRALSLDANELEDEGLRALCRSRNLTALRELHLVQNDLSAQGYEALAESPLLGRLEVLSIGDWGYGDEDWTGGLEAVTRSKRVRNLRVLRVSALTLTGARALAASPHLRNLNALDIEERAEEDIEAIVRALVDSPHLNRVTRVRLPDDGDAWKLLQRRWPLSITSDWMGY